MPVTLNTTGITFSDGTSQSSAYTTGLGDIGSYALLAYGVTGGTINSNRFSYLASGATVAGSSLRRSSVTTSNNNANSLPLTSIAFNYFLNNNAGNFQSPDLNNTTAMTGTWRVVGGNVWHYMYDISGCTVDAEWPSLLWVRIS